jgi:Rrf2 family iron-sulfur cluster assembly transcriptional regulator
MLLTRKSEYALLALIAIANSKKPKNVDLLSRELKISKSFLAKVLQELSKNSVVKSYKGASGGFSLIKTPEELTIYEVVVVAESKVPSVFACSADEEDCPRDMGERCTILPVLMKLQDKINNFLQELVLKDIM